MLIDFLTNLHADDDGGGGGSGDEDGQGKIKPSDVLQRYGQTAESALRMAEKLAESENANFVLREKNRTLRAERDGYKGKVAPEGAIVLSADEAKRWEAYQAAGTPEALTAAISERDTVQRELSDLRHQQTVRAAAEAHAYRAATLAKLPSLAGKELLMRDVTEGDATVTRAFVKDGDKETALPEYIQQHDAEFLPALTADAQQQQQNGGTPYPIQQNNSNQRQQQPNAAKAYIGRTKYAVPGKTS